MGDISKRRLILAQSDKPQTTPHKWAYAEGGWPRQCINCGKMESEMSDQSASCAPQTTIYIFREVDSRLPPIGVNSIDDTWELLRIIDRTEGQGLISPYTIRVYRKKVHGDRDDVSNPFYWVETQDCTSLDI